MLHEVNFRFEIIFVYDSKFKLVPLAILFCDLVIFAHISNFEKLTSTLKTTWPNNNNTSKVY